MDFIGGRAGGASNAAPGSVTLSTDCRKDEPMNARKIMRKIVLLIALLSIAGCGHVQTMSTENPVTVQDFGCPGGDEVCMYAPYCHP
jgi:hypothetical protein